MTYLPASHLVTFTLDANKGQYIMATCEPGFILVPEETVVENRLFNEKINATIILRGLETQKKTGPDGRSGRSIKFFTGLQPTDHKGIYLGNVLTFSNNGGRILNGIVVRFSSDARRMSLRYFPAFYPYPDARRSFVNELVRRGLI